MRGRRPERLAIARRDAAALQAAAHSDSLPWSQVRRAKIVLAIAHGEHQSSVAARLECDEATVWRTCQRYRRGGLATLFADGRRGNTGRLEQNDAEHYLPELELFRQHHRELRGAFLIQDGGSSHTAGGTQRYFAGSDGWWRPRYTPAN